MSGISAADTSAARPFCRKCLLSESGFAAEYARVADMVEALPPEKRVAEDEYRRRLELCRECGQLGAGVCGECGCFVELRAAKRAMHCPSAERKW